MSTVTYNKELAALLVIDPYKRLHLRGRQNLAPRPGTLITPVSI
jgi:hypothetical protein